jgi:hypothetical protein
MYQYSSQKVEERNTHFTGSCANFHNFVEIGGRWIIWAGKQRSEYPLPLNMARPVISEAPIREDNTEKI